jgi:hypothetical protein
MQLLTTYTTGNSTFQNGSQFSVNTPRTTFDPSTNKTTTQLVSTTYTIVSIIEINGVIYIATETSFPRTSPSFGLDGNVSNQKVVDFYNLVQFTQFLSSNKMSDLIAK